MKIPVINMWFLCKLMKTWIYFPAIYSKTKKSLANEDIYNENINSKYLKILLWLLSFHLTKYNQTNWILERIIINTLLDMHVVCSIRTTWLYVQGNVAVRSSHSTRGLGQVSGVEELQTSFHSLSWKRAKTHCKDRIHKE